MGMTKGMYAAIESALSEESKRSEAAGFRTTLRAQTGPWCNENVFWALRQAGYANDSGYITDAGREAFAAA
jgi:hypothetical protein